MKGGLLAVPKQVPFGMKTEHLASLTRRIVGLKGGYRISHALIDCHLRRHRPPVETEVTGIRMLLDPEEFVDQELLFHPQLYEAAELRYVRARLRSGETFIDVGSNIGLYSLLASIAVGENGRVVAVEADPSTFTRFVQNLRLNKITNVQAYCYAVSAKRGSAPIGGRAPSGMQEPTLSRRHSNPRTNGQRCATFSV
jgi:hypothetical protein